MKYHEEYYIENNYFFKQASKYWSISDIKELNELERLFLQAIDYRLKVSQTELNRNLNMVYAKSQELQCKRFRVYTKEFNLIEDYFSPKGPNTMEFSREEEPTALSLSLSERKSQNVPRKVPQIFLNNRVFRDSEEIMQFFNWEEICDSKTQFSEEASFSLSEESQESFLIFN